MTVTSGSRPVVTGGGALGRGGAAVVRGGAAVPPCQHPFAGTCAPVLPGLLAVGRRRLPGQPSAQGGGCAVLRRDGRAAEACSARSAVASRSSAAASRERAVRSRRPETRSRATAVPSRTSPEWSRVSATSSRRWAARSRCSAASCSAATQGAGGVRREAVIVGQPSGTARRGRRALRHSRTCSARRTLVPRSRLLGLEPTARTIEPAQRRPGPAPTHVGRARGEGPRDLRPCPHGRRAPSVGPRLTPCKRQRRHRVPAPSRRALAAGATRRLGHPRDRHRRHPARPPADAVPGRPPPARRLLAGRELPVGRSDLPAGQPAAARAAARRARQAAPARALGHDPRPEPAVRAPEPCHPSAGPGRALRDRSGPRRAGPGGQRLPRRHLQRGLLHRRPGRGRDARAVPPVLLPRRDPEPRGAGDPRLDPRGRRAGLRARARLRGGLRQPGPHRAVRRRGRRGRDRAAGRELALHEVPQPGDRRRRPAGAAPERLQDRQPDGARPHRRGRARGADARLRLHRALRHRRRPGAGARAARPDPRHGPGRHRRDPAGCPHRGWRRRAVPPGR